MVAQCTATGKRVRHYGNTDVVLSFTRYLRNEPDLPAPVGGLMARAAKVHNVAVCTVNLPSLELKDNEVAIKTWSENVGMLGWLMEQGIVSDPLHYAFFRRCLHPRSAALLVTGRPGGLDRLPSCWA